MFHAAYQDGDSVEVFTPSGKDPAVAWNLRGKVARLYDKGVKGYVLAVSGNTTSKMQIPKNPKGTLGLRQRYLVLQVLTSVSPDKPFSLELGVTDTGGTRRRLVFSSSFRTLHCTPLHAQIPLYGYLRSHRGCWSNLSVDLAGLTLACFRADAFKTLDTLTVGPTCRVRKIFTMKGALHVFDQYGESIADEDEGSAPMEPLPVRMAFPGGVKPAPRNWVIAPTTLHSSAKPRGSSSKPVPEQVAIRTRQSHGASQMRTPVSYPLPSPRAPKSSMRREESSKSSPTSGTARMMIPSPLGVRRVAATTPETVAAPLLSRQRSVPASATHGMDSSGSLSQPELMSSKFHSSEGIPSPASTPRLGNRSPLSVRRPDLTSPNVASSNASEFATPQSTILAYDPSKSTGSESSVVCDANEKGLRLPARRRLAAARGTLTTATNPAVRQDGRVESHVGSSSDSPSTRRRTPKRQVCAGLVRPSSCRGRKELNGKGVAYEKSFMDGKWDDTGQQGEQNTSRSLQENPLEGSKETRKQSPVSQSPVDKRDNTVAAGAEAILDSIGMGKQRIYHRDDDYPARPRSCRGRDHSRAVDEVSQTSTRMLPNLSPGSAAYDANRGSVEPVGGWHPRVYGDGRGYVCDTQHASDLPDVLERRTQREWPFRSEHECSDTREFDTDMMNTRRVSRSRNEDLPIFPERISSTPLSRSPHPDQRNNTSTAQTSNESDESTNAMRPSALLDFLQRFPSPSASDVHSPETQVRIGEAVETDRQQRPRLSKTEAGKIDARGEQTQHGSSLCVEGYATDVLERLLVASEVSSREVAVSRGVPVSCGVDGGIQNEDSDDDVTLAVPKDSAEGFSHVKMEDNMADEEGYVAKGQGVGSTIGGSQGVGAGTVGTESIRTRVRGLDTSGRGNLNDMGLLVEKSDDVYIGGRKCTVNPGGDEAEKLNFLPQNLRGEDSSCLPRSGVRRLPRDRQDAHRDQLEELEMKELALVDLEDSYISEFGSLSLSRSLDEVLGAHDNNNVPRSRKKTSSTFDDEDSKGASAVCGFSHRGVRGKGTSLPPGTDGHDCLDEDLDSVVPGSPESRHCGDSRESLSHNGTLEKGCKNPTKSKLCEQIPGASSSKVPFAPLSGAFDGVIVAPGNEISEVVYRGGRSGSTGQGLDTSKASGREPREVVTEDSQSCSTHVESVARGTQGLNGGGEEGVSRAAVASLMYDPVLNCLYDKATDEYYGLT